MYEGRRCQLLFCHVAGRDKSASSLKQFPKGLHIFKLTWLTRWAFFIPVSICNNAYKPIQRRPVYEHCQLPNMVIPHGTTRPAAMDRRQAGDPRSQYSTLSACRTSSIKRIADGINGQAYLLTGYYRQRRPFTACQSQFSHVTLFLSQSRVCFYLPFFFLNL